MFIFLSKKIAIPNGVCLHSLSWNPDQGWIACGCDSGLLKVLKLELPLGVRELKGRGGVAAPSNLSMNQTLDGHHGKVVRVTWNALYRKLTTADESGLIIVWMQHKGMWFEEMINNRNKSMVKDMKWTADGSKICIVYEDGAVIVGSVDGCRRWGKELGMRLNLLEWSPDSRYILFVSDQAQIFAYDAMGNKIKQLHLPILDDLGSDERDSIQVSGINWYDGSEGHSDPTAPTLAIALSNGKIQLTRGTDDPMPLIIDTKLNPLNECKWNCKGTVISVSGFETVQSQNGDRKELSLIKFYSPHGTFLRTLRVPGSGINSLSWEGGGLRIALAVDSYIYFANIRPDYLWAYFGNTLLYAFTKPDRGDMAVIFWDSMTNESAVKKVDLLRCIRAAGENCVLVTGPERHISSLDARLQALSAEDEEGKSARQVYKLTLCNAIGAPVDIKYIAVKPVHVAMTPFHIVVADERLVYIWQYRTQVLSGAKNDILTPAKALRKTASRERILDIESTSDSPASTLETFDYLSVTDSWPSDDPRAISAVTASDKNVFVARGNGNIHRYTLPHVTFEKVHKVECKPSLIRLNCDSSRLAIIDSAGLLQLMKLDVDQGNSGALRGGGHGLSGGSVGGLASEKAKFVTGIEKKDTWDVQFSDDDPDSFAVMEKTRMHIFHGHTAEPPILLSGYLASFKAHEITSVMLDEIMLNPETPSKEDHMLVLETKTMRELKELLRGNDGLAEAFAYVESNPYPRFWQIIADGALNELDLGIAEKAFVRCKDFKALQFVKHLSALSDKTKQRAEVAIYFKRFDEAESVYRHIDRKDLAIDLRMRVGDWFKVANLVQTGGGDDESLVRSMSSIGDYYADRQLWRQSAQYFTQAQNYERMAQCYYKIEDFNSLESMIPMIPEGSVDLVMQIANMFESVGIHGPAIDCYCKAGDVRKAIDCCVMLNQWDRAMELAEKHDFPQIEGLLAKYANSLLEKGELLQAVELYRKANKAPEAAKLLAQAAETVSSEQADPLRAKKLNVLAAHEVMRFRKSALDMSNLTANNAADATAATLQSLMTLDQTSTNTTGTAVGSKAAKVLDNAWRGAAAYHYYLLAQRQLYHGKVEHAMKTSIRLAEFEDILPMKDLYSLIALSAYHSKYYNVCSRAFIKLENLTDLPPSEKEDIEDLALKIFTKNAPNDPSVLPDQYLNCLENGTSYDACTASGRLIEKAATARNVTKCKICKHYMLSREIENIQNCPLCHSSII